MGWWGSCICWRKEQLLLLNGLEKTSSLILNVVTAQVGRQAVEESQELRWQTSDLESIETWFFSGLKKVIVAIT